MKRILACIVVLSFLTSCSDTIKKFQTGYEITTTATVSPKAVYVAANVFDGLEATATNYLNLPKCGQFPCRSQDAVPKIVTAIQSGRTARNNLKQFLKDHPGQLGPQGDYDALITINSTLQDIYSKYNIK